jgi:hypothetical protein
MMKASSHRQLDDRPGRARSCSPGVRAGGASNLKLETSNSRENGVALVVTLILLSVITFMAIAFLVISRHASEAVTSVTQQAIAKQAAYAAAQQAEARIVATMLAKNEGFDFGLMVSTNYQSPFYDVNQSVNALNVNNVNYTDSNGVALDYHTANYQRMLNNLLVLPRPPVVINTNSNPNFSNDFRFYLDLNRNGMYDASVTNNPLANGVTPVTVLDQFGQPETVTAGDPEWIGVLEHPDQPHSRSNFFTARYCYLAQPIGNSLDINFIHNHAKQNDLAANDGFLRNQGVGSWEINLAGFLHGLNSNYWNYDYAPFDDTGAPTTAASPGSASQDAASILQYRYGGTYLKLPSMSNMYPFSPAIFLATNNNVVDYYSIGPLMGAFAPQLLENASYPNWSGANNLNQFFTSQDLFTALASFGNTAFAGRLNSAGEGLPVPANSFPDTNFNRYTFYRMLSQMGMESAPEPATKLNLNYINIGGYAASNFVPWTDRLIEFPLGSGTFTNAALVFFTNAATRLLETQTNFVIPTPWQVFVPGVGLTNVPTNLSTGFIPIYPAINNYYTPSVHRMLQLAANIYDAANPKNITNVNDFDYPSVFRPTFWVTNIFGVTYVYVNGYEEVPNLTIPALPASDPNYLASFISLNPYYLSAPISLSVSNLTGLAGQIHTNIYGIPWVIGAKGGLPNFNQISMESYSEICRKLEIVKGTLTTPRAKWQTNVEYVVGVSNVVTAEAWNSYSAFFPHLVDIGGIDLLNMAMTNETGKTIVFTNLALGISASVTNWPGYQAFSSDTNVIAASFRAPLISTVPFLPDSIYYTNTAIFTPAPNPITAGFYTTTGYPQPLFALNTTNRLRFWMVDHATGRVIDYVQLDGMTNQRNLTAELAGDPSNPAFLYGDGGVWDTNRYGGSTSLSVLVKGMDNQISVSLGQSNFPGYQPILTSDWEQAQVQQQGFSSVDAAISKFSDFFNNTGGNTSTEMQVPYTPTRQVCVYCTWQANDPLVHYTLPDLTGLGDLSTLPLTNWEFTNRLFANIFRVNDRYLPWGTYSTLKGGNAAYNTNMSLKDPQVTRSDDWQFPDTKLPNIGWLGRVHRGTPWQTVYMKSPPVDPTLWQNWTGDGLLYPGTNLASDAFISQPTNDWGIFDLFTTAPNDNATRGQLSVNQTNYAAWAALLDGVVVLTNSATNGITPIIIDPNTNAAGLFSILTGITAQRAINNSAGVFTRVGDILATPALTVASPFLDVGDPTNTTQLNDAAYERLPQQIMSLLRVGQPRYVIYAYGQSLKPAERSIVPGGQFYGTCTNYQITGEVVTRTVVRFEPATALDPANPYTAMNPSQNPVMPLIFTNPAVILPPRLPMRGVVESFTVLPPE